MDITEEKRRLRRRLAQPRRNVDPALARAAGSAVADHLAAAPEFVSASSLVLYWALPDEVPTLALFERFRQSGKPVLLPRVVGPGLEFALVHDPGDLKRGRFGVLAPSPASPARRPDEAALVCVPGVAFDREGNRLGRGAGYYDRTFPPRTRAPRLFGIAYAFQLVERVPHGPGDRRMDAVVTEQGIVRCGSGRGMDEG